MDKDYTISIKTIYYNTCKGRKKISEFSSKEIPSGLYSTQDTFIGKIITFKMPSLFSGDKTNLNWAISHFNDFDTLSAQYKTLIETDPLVKWFLIPCLILHEKYKRLFPELNNLPLSHDKLFTPVNKKKFQRLNQFGAEYQHVITGYGKQKPINSEDLSLILKVFDDKKTAYIPEHQFSLLLFAILNNLDKNKHITIEGKKKIQLMLMTGIDINLPLDVEFRNTLLQYLIALEVENVVIDFMDLVTELTTIHLNISHINFSQKDAQGKTPLLFAVGLGQKKVVEKILQFPTVMSPADLGLNAQDSAGRTPAMIAAALGRKDILDMLISAGCDLRIKDNQGRDIYYYINTPEHEIRAIFATLSIHPDRADRQAHNYLYDNQINFTPLVIINKNHPEKEELILRSTKPEHFNHLSLLYKKILEKDQTLVNAGIDGEFIKAQLRPLFNSDEQLLSSLKNNTPPNVPTVLEQCLINQQEFRFLMSGKINYHKNNFAAAFVDYKNAYQTKSKAINAETINQPNSELQQEAEQGMRNSLLAVLKSDPTNTLVNSTENISFSLTRHTITNKRLINDSFENTVGPINNLLEKNLFLPSNIIILVGAIAISFINGIRNSLCRHPLDQSSQNQLLQNLWSTPNETKKSILNAVVKKHNQSQFEKGIFSSVSASSAQLLRVLQSNVDEIIKWDSLNNYIVQEHQHENCLKNNGKKLFCIIDCVLKENIELPPSKINSKKTVNYL
jgi:hypothetical protein